MKDIITKLAVVLPDQVDNKEEKGGDLTDQVVNILNAIIGVLSFVCVVVIIIGGVQYMTSSGDAGKVKKAKDTILYGVIGLAVCVLAFAIVNFVITSILS